MIYLYTRSVSITSIKPIDDAYVVAVHIRGRGVTTFHIKDDYGHRDLRLSQLADADNSWLDAMSIRSGLSRAHIQDILAITKQANSMRLIRPRKRR